MEADSTVVAPPLEDSATAEAEIIADTSIIKTIFDNANDSIIKWKQGREFGYMSYLDSLLKKRKDLKIDTVSVDQPLANKKRARVSFPVNNSTNNFLNHIGVKIFFWILAVLFIGFILYKLFFAGGLFAGRNTKANEEPVNAQPEKLSEYAAYNTFIYDAELKNDFNLAIRYLYLQSLKKLADSELITFSPDKTNNLYIKELSAHRYQQQFSFLTFNYEYAWYGKVAVDMPRYQKLKEEFISFNKKIQAS